MIDFYKEESQEKIYSDNNYTNLFELAIKQREKSQQIEKDRLDFGFDSIYFRYDIILRELADLKEKEAIKNGTHFNKKSFIGFREQRFWEVLEQLTHAHEDGDNK